MIFDIPLKVKKTDRTPEFYYDPKENFFDIKGVSVPENATEFYDPIIKWVDGYILTNPKSITINIELDYFSPKSLICLMRIFKKFEQFDSTINWFYDDNDIHQCGIDLEDLLKIKFNFINKEVG